MAATHADTVKRLHETVRPDQGLIPGFIHNDPDVYQLERERIFQHCWLFVAHESEVSAPGDYVTRTMGEEPVIVTRGEDGRIRVFLNACRHRGMRVCRADMGNTSHFRCPYHGFTYQNTGALVGVPFEKEIYSDSLDKGQLGLIEARAEVYAGLVFATWNPDAPPLLEYLGPMTWYLDFVARRAPMETVGPPTKRMVKANWKLPSENFCSDSYHTMFAHASIAKIGLAKTTTFSKNGYQIAVGNGHGLNLGHPATGPVFPEELYPVYEQNLSPEQYAVFKDLFNLPGLVFPNLAIMISTVFYRGRFVSHTSLHLMEPCGPEQIELTSWLLMEKDAPGWWKETSRKLYILTFSPSGIFDQDDMENFTDMTATRHGRMAAKIDYNYQMGIGRRMVTDFPGPGDVYDGKYCEANARAYYKRWLELMLAGTGVKV